MTPREIKSLPEFLLEMRAAALEADERRAGILVEVFESARPEDYNNLLDVLDDAPEAVIATLEKEYVILRVFKSTFLNLPNWPDYVRFIQHAIRLNESHKENRKLKR